jgi:NAD(P)-dependent dehydrogenase (short-subunit alcohol dehydrogenase family)
VSGRFAGRVPLVAGGTGGLGREVGLAFLEESARVALPYHRVSGFEALRNEAGSAASQLEGFATDVTSESSVRELVAAIMAKHGRLDAMANAVGGYAAGANLWETDPKVMPSADFAKWPKPQEIARVILFLCSDDAKLVRGASITV